MALLLCAKRGRRLNEQQGLPACGVLELRRASKKRKTAGTLSYTDDPSIVFAYFQKHVVADGDAVNALELARDLTPLVLRHEMKSNTRNCTCTKVAGRSAFIDLCFVEYFFPSLLHASTGIVGEDLS